jgi:microcystin-dependent protein
LSDTGYAQPAIGNAGGNSPHNNLQPFCLVNYAIIALEI